jgi:predicted MPP superfamily phosphohydrolase
LSQGWLTLRRRISVFVGIVQAILFAGHVFLYETCRFFLWPAATTWKLQVAMGVLSASFVAASLQAWRYNNVAVRVFYRFAAAWLGALHYLLMAAVGCWAAYGAALLSHRNGSRREIAIPLFMLAILVSVWGMVNAAWTRVTRVTVELPNLPAAWRGRTAALAGDTHLGHVRGRGFSRRIARMVARWQPDVVFLTGDLYDGTAVDAPLMAEPWGEIPSRFGTYFVAGNHEQFRSDAKYIGALEDAGVRVLENEKVTLDGLQIVGVPYRDGHDARRLRKILRRTAIDPGVASILLIHEPSQLPVAEEEGVSLQLSGHTHRGQFFPRTLAVRRIFGRFAYGLQQWGEMQVYVTSGAGTWGPPLRVGTNSEIVLITFI